MTTTVTNLFFELTPWVSLGCCLLLLWMYYRQRRLLREVLAVDHTLRSGAVAAAEEIGRLSSQLEIETRRANEYLGVITTAQGERDRWSSWYRDACTQYGAAQQLFMAEREVNISRMRQAGITPYHDRLLNLAIDALREREAATEPCRPPSAESHPEQPIPPDAA